MAQVGRGVAGIDGVDADVRIGLGVLSLDTSGARQDGQNDLSRRFRELLDRDFAIAHDVGHYARTLGYSTRTLARATQAALAAYRNAEIADALVVCTTTVKTHAARILSKLGVRERGQAVVLVVR